MRLRLATTGVLAALTLGATMPHAFAQSTVIPQQPGDPGYESLLAAATAPLRDALGDAVTLDIERLDRLGRWAFLQATMRSVDGGRPDYAGTPYAERAESGGMSDVYVALLRTEPESGGDDTDGRTSGAPSAATDGSDAAEDAPGDAPAVRWTLVDHAIGPSDVAWLTWPQAHAAPRHLFGF